MIIEDRQKFIWVTATGQLSASRSVELCGEAIALAKKEGLRRFLFDFQDAVPNLTFADIFRIPDQLRMVMPIPQNRTAIVYRRYRIIYRFVETMTFNRGYQVKVFEDMDEAMKWLIQDQTPAPHEA